MQIFIPTDLTFSSPFSQDVTPEVVQVYTQEMQGLHTILKSYDIKHTYKVDTSGIDFKIEPQKCSLPEKDMNTFFYNVVGTFFPKVKLNYVAAGLDTDFSLELIQEL